MTKVTMPEPVVLRTVMPDDYRYGNVYGYTRKQMEAYAAAKVREALEDAVKAVDLAWREAIYDFPLPKQLEAIRALIPK